VSSCGGACGSCASCVAAGSLTSGLLQRQAPLVQRLRARFQAFTGSTVYSVYLVWTKWSGEERGEGDEREIASVRILPSPDVQDLSAISYDPRAAGVLPSGTVRVNRVNSLLSADSLAGRSIPPQAYFDGCGLSYGSGVKSPQQLGMTDAEKVLARGAPRPGEHIEQPYEFFYEIVEDDVPNAQRQKFRLASFPFKRPGQFDWIILLERVSEDRTRSGESRIGIDPDR
jgi:hypothetical protein